MGRSTRGLRVWTILACVVWALSFVGPLGATTVSAGVALALLHLGVGGVLVLGLRRSHAQNA